MTRMVIQLGMTIRVIDHLEIIHVNHDQRKGSLIASGHPAGDEVLRQVAEAIRNHTRRVDLSARIGGDEFLVLLPEASLDVATEVAKRVRREITSKPFEEMTVSVSVGIGQWDEAFNTPQGFLHAVDQALYQPHFVNGTHDVGAR